MVLFVKGAGATMAKRRSIPKNIEQKGGIENSEKLHESIAAKLGQTGVTAEERYELISKAAYFRAERRRFIPGAELEDWLEAEVEVDGIIGKTAADKQSKGA